MNENVGLASGEMSVTSWKIGQKPNMALLFGVSICCCWLGYYFHLYNLYTELKRFFPQYDSSMTIVKVLIPIVSWITLDNEIDALAKEANVSIPSAKIPALACILCALLAPYVLADQMNRINALCKAVAEQGK